MNLIDFVNKYIKTKVDYDGVYGAQCVDLFRQYAKELLLIPEHTGGVEGAKDIYLNYEKMPLEKKYFCKLRADITSLADAGDIAIWNATETNKYGHIAIVLEDTGIGDLIVFEQNGFTQEGAKIARRSKNNLLGYLRKWEN